METATPRTLWHASRNDIQRPTIAGRTPADNHDNSGLGIYCATAPFDYICGFGPHVHALEIKDTARAMQMTISDLSRMGQHLDFNEGSRDWFEQEGRRLAEVFDIIELVEITGEVGQVIVLRDDVVVSSKRFTQEEYAAFALDHSAHQLAMRTASRPGV